MLRCVSTAFILLFISVPTSLATGLYKSVEELWGGELGDLTDDLSLSPYLGGQDFYQCCLKALNQSLLIEEGNPVLAPNQTFLRGNISNLLTYQNPCTASYNGSDGDQPQLIISYTWCHQTCPGWQRANTEVAEQWIEPLIAFILPTIVFCFTIPRRRRLIIPLWLFPYNKFTSFPGNLTLLFKIPVAVIIVVVDAIVWALTSIVLAGPMILSGCLERMLDSRILEFLSSPENENIITTQSRSQMLLMILIGNLDVESTWKYSENLVKPLVDFGATSCDNSLTDTPSDAKTLPFPMTSEASTEAHDPVVILQADTKNNNPTIEKSNIDAQGANQRQAHDIPNSQIEGNLSNLQLQSMKSKLSSLLESQPTFGSSVGIGVLFYTSSFLYSINEIRSNYGDSSTSHSLAFGIFWMIVGHVAVIASILLAGNNPSAWEAIASEPANLTHLDPGAVQWRNRVARRRSSIKEAKSWMDSSIQKRRITLPASLKLYLYRTSFPSKFRSAWMWNRGLSKALWIAQMSENNPTLVRLQRDVLYIGWAGWVFEMALPTIALIVVPAFLGGMTSYTTPTIGLSCRSMIPLLYASSQVILTLLWVWDWKSWKTAKTGKFVTARELRAQKLNSMSVSEIGWYGCFLWCIITSVFTASGGTVFHLMGLFQNCLCWIPIWQWSRRYSPDSTTYLSSNSSEQIYYARTFWLPIGITATALLLATTYFGWQYQHRLRRDFANQVEYLGKVKDNSTAAPSSSLAPA